MPKGKKCSFCDKFMLHIVEPEGFSRCSNCGFVGWWTGDRVRPGSGMGFKCINCKKNTLHFLATVEESKKVAMFRCSTCLYAGVRPNHPVA